MIRFSGRLASGAAIAALVATTALAQDGRAAARGMIPGGQNQGGPTVVQLPAPAPAPTTARPATPITLREREILMWVRDGLSNHAIGAKLGISALTVKNHVQKILRKLGASNRAQAVAIAMSINAWGDGLGAAPAFRDSQH